MSLQPPSKIKQTVWLEYFTIIAMVWGNKWNQSMTQFVCMTMDHYTISSSRAKCYKWHCHWIDQNCVLYMQMSQLTIQYFQTSSKKFLLPTNAIFALGTIKLYASHIHGGYIFATFCITGSKSIHVPNLTCKVC